MWNFSLYCAGYSAIGHLQKLFLQYVSDCSSTKNFVPCKFDTIQCHVTHSCISCFKFYKILHFLLAVKHSQQFILWCCFQWSHLCLFYWKLMPTKVYHCTVCVLTVWSMMIAAGVFFCWRFFRTSCIACSRIATELPPRCHWLVNCVCVCVGGWKRERCCRKWVPSAAKWHCLILYNISQDAMIELYHKNIWWEAADCNCVLGM